MKKYEYIYKELVSLISTKYNIGDKLESETYFANEFNVSRSTIRLALDKLQHNGYILKHQGKESTIISKGGFRKSVLLIVPNIFNYIFVDIVTSIEQVLRANNINLLLVSSYNSHEIEQEIIYNYLYNVDAVIFEPAQSNILRRFNKIDPLYENLNMLPTVVINSQIYGYNYALLEIDDQNAMYNLTTHILDTNVTSFLSVAKIDDTQGYNRLLGIEQAIKQSSQSITYNSITFDTFTSNTIIDNVIEFIKQRSVRCIMFYNDEYANKFLLKLNELGIDCKKFIITGFDNSEYSINNSNIYASPSHPKSQMGIDAANLIINSLSGEQISSIQYDVELNIKLEEH